MKKAVKKTAKKRVAPKTAWLINTKGEIIACLEVLRRESHSQSRRLDILEPLVGQLLAEQKPLLEELYRARQGALSVMKDMVSLKARVFGSSSGWTPDGGS